MDLVFEFFYLQKLINMDIYEDELYEVVDDWDS